MPLVHNVTFVAIMIVMSTYCNELQFFTQMVRLSWSLGLLGYLCLTKVPICLFVYIFPFFCIYLRFRRRYLYFSEITFHHSNTYSRITIKSYGNSTRILTKPSNLSQPNPTANLSQLRESGYGSICTSRGHFASISPR